VSIRSDGDTFLAALFGCPKCPMENGKAHANNYTKLFAIICWPDIPISNRGPINCLFSRNYTREQQPKKRPANAKASEIIWQNLLPLLSIEIA